MVKKEGSVYLFVGQDNLSKSAQVEKLKNQFSSPRLKDFNLDILYAKDLDLEGLQEKLLYLPLKTEKRIILIRDAAKLKETVKEFILLYLKHPHPTIILIFDSETHSPKDAFLNSIARYAQVYRFKEAIRIDAFTLSRAIDSGKPAYALRVLSQLLRNQEKPERILGGLRYAWENNNLAPLQARRRMKLLLNCDLAIKTGKLKAGFALEKLVVDLCGFTQSAG